MNRRALLLGTTVAAVSAGFVVHDAVTSRGTDEVPEVGNTGVRLPRVNAQQADLVAASIGVNTHFNFAETVYHQVDRVLEAIDDLGVRHIRDRIVHAREVPRAFAELGRSGVRVQGVCGALDDPETMTSVMAGVLSNHPDPEAVYSAFEGINEANNDGVPWIEETRTKTRDLFFARNAAGLDRIPIVSPALARVNERGVEGETTLEQSNNLGSLTEYVDLGNIHVYPRQQLPSDDIDRFMTYQRSITGALPMVCSEGGYFTAMNYTGGAFPTPEDVCAVYLPRMIMEHWIRGNPRFYFYELLDQPDPTDSVRLSSFGLLRVDGRRARSPWTPKAHHHALRNLIVLLEDEGAPHDVGGLRLELTGAPDAQQVLLAKRDGSRHLVVWRDLNIYDPVTRTRLATSSVTATLTLESPRDVRIYNPTRSSVPMQTVEQTLDVTFPLGAELLVLQIG